VKKTTHKLMFIVHVSYVNLTSPTMTSKFQKS